jgi:hypothetical protein
MDRIPLRGDVAVHPHLAHGKDSREVLSVTGDRLLEHVTYRRRVEFVETNSRGFSSRSQEQ